MNKKKDTIILLILAILFIFIQYNLKPKGIKIKTEYYNEMVSAAKKMKYMSEKIKAERLRRNIPIDKELDKNETGLIGLEWSSLTTTLGSLESKRTSCDPDFAALLVKLFKENGLKKGDVIAANLSSSFPALNLAFISAVDTLELKTVIITSIGASTYGGNIEEFNYLDMENYLYSKNIIVNKTQAWSLGGVGDIGREFDDDIIENLKYRNNLYGLDFIYEEELKKNLDKRYNYYKEKGENKIKAFINIGGNLLSLGGSVDIITNEKILLDKNTNMKNGLVGLFLKKDIPVYYLLNLKSITSYYKMQFDPDKFENIGESNIYFKSNYEIWNWVIVILFLIFIAYKGFSSHIKK